MRDDMFGWIRWPLVIKAILFGMGLGSIYGVATSQFVFGILVGAVSGFGFALGRSYTT